jgi:outer membrane protein assembly factor BamD
MTFPWREVNAQTTPRFYCSAKQENCQGLRKADERARPARVNWRGISHLALLVPVLQLAPGCVEDSRPPVTAAQYQLNAKQAYDEALEEFLSANWEYATQLMDGVQRNYAYTPYARQAQLRMADIAFRQDKYPEAISQYKAFVHDHPNDAEVPYARYRIIRAQFETSPTSAIQPPLEERDLANVRDAHTAVRAFLADYPNYGHSEELAYILQSVSGMLVRHELYVARFYMRSDEFNAAARRVQYALRNFQDTGMEPEGIVLLGEVYLKQKEVRKAVALFRYLLQAYPDSAFVVPAKRFLEIGERALGGSAASVAQVRNLTEL